jgi:hypothetical protein
MGWAVSDDQTTAVVQRRELNDPARRLEYQPAAAELYQRLVPSPVRSGSGLTPDGDVGRTMVGSTDRVRLISRRERDYDSRRDRDARPQPEAR